MRHFRTLAHAGPPSPERACAADAASSLAVGTTLDDYAEWVLHPQLPVIPTRPRSSYFVCGTNRSGSCHLCGLLASTGVAGRPHEWFYEDTEATNRRAWGISLFSDYLRGVHDAGTTPNGVFGSKLMWDQMEKLVLRLKHFGEGSTDRSLIERHFPSPRFVWIWREDVAAQAVSWAKAIQTGLWHHWDASGSSAVPIYDHDQIETLAQKVTESNSRWRAWFAANDIQPLVVRFEDLVAERVAVTRDVLGDLGLASERIAIAERTVKTSDHINAEWLDRYRASS
jgi:trehalose 2-sulfotransferase